MSRGYDFIDLSDWGEIPSDVLARIPDYLVRAHHVVPVEIDAVGRLVVAVVDPTDTELIDRIRFIVNREIKIVVSPADGIDKVIQKCYGELRTDADDRCSTCGYPLAGLQAAVCPGCGRRLIA